MEDENIEFENLNRPPPEEEGGADDDPARYEETSFWDKPQELDRSIMWGEEEKSSSTTSKPDDTKNVRAFLAEKLQTKTGPDAGPDSKKLYESTTLDNGLKYLGTKIIGEKGTFSKNKSYANKIKKFKSLLENAQREYTQTLDYAIEQETNVYSKKANKSIKQDFFEKSVYDLQNINDTVQDYLKERENQSYNFEQKIDKYETLIAQKNVLIRQLTQDLGKQAIDRGKEFSQLQREKKIEIDQYKTQIQKLQTELEQKPQDQQDLQKQIDLLQDKLQTTRVNLNAAEKENIELQIQVSNKSQSEKQSLQNEVAAVRQARNEAQDQLESAEKQLAVLKNQIRIPSEKLREANAILQGSILREKIPIDTKLQSLEQEQKYWLEQAKKESNPEVKFFYGSVQKAAANLIDNLFLHCEPR